MAVGDLLVDRLLFSQQPKTVPPWSVRIDIHVAKVSGNQLTTVNASAQSEILLLDDNATIWKGGINYSGAAAAQVLQPGDELNVRGRLDPVTKQFIAVAILANWTFISGTISSVPVGTTFEMLPARQASLTRKVTYSANTEFVQSAPEDMASGSPIDVVGSVLKDQSIQATTITVFNAQGRPTRMDPNTVLIRPDGSKSRPRP